MSDYYCPDCKERLANMYGSGHECKQAKPSTSVNYDVYEVGLKSDQLIAVVELLAHVKIASIATDEEAVDLYGAYRALLATAARIPGYVPPFERQ